MAGDAMTDRDPVVHAPTCPICGTHERVQREAHRWLCGGCWTVFSGGQGEWEQEREHREKRARAYQWIRERADKQETDA